MSFEEWLSLYERAHGKVSADVARGSLTFGDGNPMMTIPTKLIETAWMELMKYVESGADIIIKSMGRTFGQMHRLAGGASVDYVDLHLAVHGLGRAAGDPGSVTVVGAPVQADPRPIALFLAGFLEGVLGGTYDGECKEGKCTFHRL